MKINGSSDSPRLDRPAGKNVGSDTPAVKPAATGTAGEKIELSDLSRALATLGGKTADGAEFDQARVDAIKEAIRRGEFKVNPEAVADRLIQSVRELLGHKA